MVFEYSEESCTILMVSGSIFHTIKVPLRILTVLVHGCRGSEDPCFTLIDIVVRRNIFKAHPHNPYNTRTLRILLPTWSSEDPFFV